MIHLRLMPTTGACANWVPRQTKKFHTGIQCKGIVSSNEEQFCCSSLLRAKSSSPSREIPEIELKTGVGEEGGVFAVGLKT